MKWATIRASRSADAIAGIFGQFRTRELRDSARKPQSTLLAPSVDSKSLPRMHDSSGFGAAKAPKHQDAPDLHPEGPCGCISDALVLDNPSLHRISPTFPRTGHKMA